MALFLNRTEPNRTEPNRTEPNRTEPNRTEPNPWPVARGPWGWVVCLLSLGLLAVPVEGQMRGVLENPGAGSSQSGIGVISGWVCEAETIGIEIETEGEAVEQQGVAYGTERVDTQAACGDTANGFGVLFNWNRLGEGEHTVVVVVDEEELGRATFTVTTLGEEFVRGVTGETLALDFPEEGTDVRLVWQEGLQNFVIVADAAGAGSVPAGQASGGGGSSGGSSTGSSSGGRSSGGGSTSGTGGNGDNTGSRDSSTQDEKHQPGQRNAPGPTAASHEGTSACSATCQTPAACTPEPGNTCESVYAMSVEDWDELITEAENLAADHQSQLDMKGCSFTDEATIVSRCSLDGNYYSSGSSVSGISSNTNSQAEKLECGNHYCVRRGANASAEYRQQQKQEILDANDGRCDGGDPDPGTCLGVADVYVTWQGASTCGCSFNTWLSELDAHYSSDEN